MWTLIKSYFRLIDTIIMFFGSTLNHKKALSKDYTNDTFYLILSKSLLFALFNLFKLFSQNQRKDTINTSVMKLCFS